MPNIGMKVTNPEGGTTYLPQGSKVEAIDLGNGTPIADAAVFIDHLGELTVGPASDLVRTKPAPDEPAEEEKPAPAPVPASAAKPAPQPAPVAPKPTAETTAKPQATQKK